MRVLIFSSRRFGRAGLAVGLLICAPGSHGQAHGDGQAPAENPIQAPAFKQLDPLSEPRGMLTLGQVDKAEAWLSTYLGDHPKSAEGHFLLGNVLLREKKPKESLAEFTAGAAIKRPAPVELKAVASAYVLLGDLEDADKWYSEVTVETPEDANAWYLLGRTKYNEGYYDKAASSFEHALSLNPKYLEAENNLGLAYKELNDSAKAKAAFQLAIDWQADAPLDPQPYLNMGTLLAEQGEIDKAIPYLTKAVELSPTNPKVHEQLGTAYQAQEKMPEAQAEMEKAVALSPGTSALHFKLGEIYRKEGKKDLAQEQFKITEKLNSTHSSKEIPNSYSLQPTTPH